MATYTVRVFLNTNDEGQEVFEEDVEVPDDPDLRIAIEGVPISPVEQALYVVAPEICPFDCDHCRD